MERGICEAPDTSSRVEGGGGDGEGSDTTTAGLDGEPGGITSSRALGDTGSTGGAAE
jgi:hypothetical protein